MEIKLKFILALPLPMDDVYKQGNKQTYNYFLFTAAVLSIIQS